MYNLYKYYDILELEKEAAPKFTNFTGDKGIIICPPVLKRQGLKYVLAYLVLGEPKETDNHLPIKRPIGIILRNRKNKKIINIYNMSKYEFIYGHDSFEREYYNLETYPQYWPNRTPDNEEHFRIILEHLYKIVSNMGVFEKLDKEEYDKYLSNVYSMFPKSYICFFEALMNNDITAVDGDILDRREEIKIYDHRRESERQNKLQENNEISKKAFIKDIENNMCEFIMNDIYTALSSKGAYAKIDFFEYLGKMVREIEFESDNYLNCFNTALPQKALKANQHSTFETIKVNLVKTYAKACVKPLVNDPSLTDISQYIFDFLEAQLDEENNGEVTDSTTQRIRNAMTKITFELNKISNPTALVEMKELTGKLENDYFEGVNIKDMSDIYLGYRMYYGYTKRNEK